MSDEQVRAAAETAARKKYPSLQREQGLCRLAFIDGASWQAAQPAQVDDSEKVNAIWLATCRLCLDRAKDAIRSRVQMSEVQLRLCLEAIDGLMQPKAKTPAERVTVEPTSDLYAGPDGHRVMQDGKPRIVFIVREDAEIYAAGLRAQLAAEADRP
jgi:hypothetical protein